MKNSISKTKMTAAIALVLLMASVTLMANVPVQPVQAQAFVTPSQWGPLPAGVTPDVTVITYPFLSVTPNPVGVDQTVLVNIWTTPPADICVYASNYKVTRENKTEIDAMGISPDDAVTHVTR